MTDDPRSQPVPSDAEVAASLRAVDDALGPLSLADDALWLEPSHGLEDAVVEALTGGEQSAATVPAVKPKRRSLAFAAAAVAALVAATAMVVVTRTTSPDWEVALDGTEAAPQARAVAKGWNEASGTRIAIEADGLPAAPQGFYYELWLSRGPIHISGGTFHDAGTDVQLWVGASRADFPRVWITLEPIDEDPTPAINVLDTGPSS